ncbi:hypothetical protein [Aureimonas sp. SK2]|uniref:hypothetical protein n=1 Tax=Aureimonas sp. SK2 TaxID=3015992 RepID=UPI002444AFDC|nr:hypothetical protein [Aureimonas sp. SK2]
MRIRLTEITTAQGDMLRRLDDGPARDSVGLHTGDLATDELRRCLELHALGLVSVAIGWRDTCWFRLTAAGRRLGRQLAA